MVLPKKYNSSRQLQLFVVVWVFYLAITSANAQFAPPAGQEGSTAIKADSSIFVGWAENCVVTRGLMDISDTELGFASFGTDSLAVGIANNDVVSFGDGGYALMQFETAVVDGPGYDFAVFENSFLDDFLELAFVEVSSDGENFFRFENTSNTQTLEQISTFGLLDATKINNLAGKYRGGYGTPFDLQELSGITGLDIHNITSIKIIDVVGSIDSEFASYDSQLNAINDPWPTPFESSGFDLDAVGIIHNEDHTAVEQFKNDNEYSIGPNPFNNFIKITGIKEQAEVSIFDLNSKIVFNINVDEQNSILISGAELPKGLLFIRISTNENIVTRKILHN